MWLKFDLDGMLFELNITNYMANQDYDGSWSKVSYNFKFKDVINYSINKTELLLNCEIDDLIKLTEELLNDELNDDVLYESKEEEFVFIFNPKYDIRNDPKLLFVKTGKEIIDISMEIQVYLSNDGLTANYFSTTLNREEIEAFYLYLSLITRKIDIENEKIQKLIYSGILDCNVEQ